MPARGLAPAARLALALLALLAGSTALAQYTYNVSRYHRYVSVGSWWPVATTTNNTASSLIWRVSYSIRRCREYSGAVSLLREASSSLGYDRCSTTSHSSSTSLAPYTSAAFMKRDVVNLNYYEIRKYLRDTGRLVDSGHATERDSYQDYGFSAHY
jgi:hypothetical protein